jgi:DNA topoisomerase-1
MDVVPMPELRCEKVDDFYLLRDGASGLFLAASQFPKFRETRAPLVIELLPHRAEIDPKYEFLFSAPQRDTDGNPAIVRFSRKTRQQYVQTETNGKPTGWRAFYSDGRWVEGKGAADDSEVAGTRARKSVGRPKAAGRKPPAGKEK